MLVSVIRNLFKHIGVTALTDDDVYGIIRTFKLDKLPPHYIFMLSSTLPILELIIAKLMKEEIDYSALVEGSER